MLESLFLLLCLLVLLTPLHFKSANHFYVVEFLFSVKIKRSVYLFIKAAGIFSVLYFFMYFL